MWAESAKEHGLSDNMAWQQSRVDNLHDQMTSIQAQADERKWAVDVMAKQVVKGASENANMKLMIDDLQQQLRSQKVIG